MGDLNVNVEIGNRHIVVDDQRADAGVCRIVIRDIDRDIGFQSLTDHVGERRGPGTGAVGIEGQFELDHFETGHRFAQENGKMRCVGGRHDSRRQVGPRGRPVDDRHSGGRGGQGTRHPGEISAAPDVDRNLNQFTGLPDAVVVGGVGRAGVDAVVADVTDPRRPAGDLNRSFPFAFDPGQGRGGPGGEIDRTEVSRSTPGVDPGVERVVTVIEIHSLCIVGTESRRTDQRRGAGRLVDRVDRIIADVVGVHLPGAVDRDVDNDSAARSEGSDKRRGAGCWIENEKICAGGEEKRLVDRIDRQAGDIGSQTGDRDERGVGAGRQVNRAERRIVVIGGVQGRRRRVEIHSIVSVGRGADDCVRRHVRQGEGDEVI